MLWLAMAAGFRTEQRIAADENASAEHIKRKCNDLISEKIAMFLGLPDRDMSWLTPWGEDVTHLCDASDSGFGSDKWTARGWILDVSSMDSLRREYPEHPRLVFPVGRTSQTRR